MAQDSKRRETERVEVEGEGERERAREGERETPCLWLLFFCFSCPRGLPYVNRTSQECCLLYRRSSLGSSTFVLFLRAFPFPVFYHRYCGLLVPILTTSSGISQFQSAVLVSLFWVCSFGSPGPGVRKRSPIPARDTRGSAGCGKRARGAGSECGMPEASAGCRKEPSSWLALFFLVP